MNDDHAIFKDAEIVFENDRIIFVGHKFPGEVDECIAAGDAIVSPGFIDLNALGDIDHDLLHQEAPPHLHNSLLWSQEYFLENPTDWMTPSEEAFKSFYAYSQLILNGITTAMPITSVLSKGWAETVDELRAAADNAGKLGLRTYLGPSYQSGMRVVNRDGSISVEWKEQTGQEGLRRAVDFVREVDGKYNGLVRGMLAPERIETITPELLVESRRWSDELGCPIRLHAAQGLFEVSEIYRRHQKTPIQYLSDLGFLGPRVSIPHAVFVNGYTGLESGGADDLALLSESKTTVIHCPVIMARHGRAMMSFGRYQQAGIPLAMGTDTFPPDMFQNIRIGSYVARVVDNSIHGNTFADLFRAATLGGAAALGRSDLGRLSPGAKADMIIINLDQLHFGVQDDPLRTILISASGRDVTMSIIDGRVVMRNRKIVGVDLAKAQVDGQRYFEKMKQGYLRRDYLHHEAHLLFPPSFPILERKEGQSEAIIP